MDYILLSIELLLAVVMFILLVLQIKNRGNFQPYCAINDGLKQMENRLAVLEKSLENTLQGVRADLSWLRTESSNEARQGRDELNQRLKSFEDSLLVRMNEIALLQKTELTIFTEQLNHLIASNEQKLDNLRQTVEDKLKELQQDNNQKLEQMRQTVDEKLHATLEKRLGESFKLVSDRLEMVHKGLGEMQTLAAGVGDLKKVLTNVKTRGIWGEIQLGNLLEQVLGSEQYTCNVSTRPGSSERVDFAIKLPGSKPDSGEVWLPIDAKFPQEDYLRLVEASEQGRADQAEEAGKQLEKRIKLEARMVQEKYLDPPHTTDFGIIYLPTESLYAEVVKRPGLLESLQNSFRVMVTGPSTMMAFLNSLSVGFRTLAIEQRTSEVWELLGAVKNEFGNFGDILDKTKKKLEEASTSIDSASRRSRSIERRLRAVQELPSGENSGIPE
ncbi:MAG: DNA recombination protein RmuC [Syntrophomonadaceae bacterium]|nr:DNA recombination protein RmuC [Syntrophomonadaceae bacterium]